MNPNLRALNNLEANNIIEKINQFCNKDLDVESYLYSLVCDPTFRIYYAKIGSNEKIILRKRGKHLDLSNFVKKIPKSAREAVLNEFGTLDNDLFNDIE